MKLLSNRTVTMVIGSERKPVILVVQLHKEAVYERKDERIFFFF